MELVEEKGFSRVSVKDIAERSGITRGTFYLYFEDKYELLQRIEDGLFEGMLKATEKVPYIHVAFNGLNEEYMKSFIRYFRENGEAFALICGEKGDPGFVERMKGMVREYWKEQNLLGNLAIPENYAAAVITDVSNSIIFEWVRGGFKESEEELILISKKISANILQKIFKEK